MSGLASTTFADRLKEAQGEMGTEKLARQIDVSLRLVQRWRSGKGEPSAEYLARLCAALNRPVEFFYPDRVPEPLTGEAA